MRCINCGWPNKPGATACVKCNHPLTQSDVVEQPAELSQTRMESQISSSLKKTVFEQEPFVMPNPKESEVCPSCGYPVRSGSESCPQCRMSLVPEQKEQQQADNNVSISSKKPITGVQGTVNPYLMSVEEEQPCFTLTVQKRINERKEFDTLEFVGSDIALNRSNTESNNGSITSVVQAQVTCEGEKWYIEDRSEQHTTFVLAKRKTELQDGDLILLGDRLFEFHAK